ncbi:MAG: ATP-binding cassette domain-containing protein [Coriobacteriales bacterium]|nr:ATP-binding cassette domain-containing protein [Coriobacteriales bacterium]
MGFSKADKSFFRHGTRMDAFTVAAMLATCAVLIFIGSALIAIVAAGVSHFGEALGSAEVLFSLRMSVVTSSISTALCVLFALPCAYVLTHTLLPGRRVVELLLELTLSLPYILLGFALLLVFSSPMGKALKEAGLAVVFQPVGIVFAQLIVNLPFTIRMLRTAMTDVNPRMEFVASTLGASPARVFWTVVLPLCRNAIVSTVVLTWARGMGEFGATLMLVGVTRMKTETLPGSIYLSISTGNNDTAMATAMIMLLVSAVTLLVANLLNRPIGTSRVGVQRRRWHRRKRGCPEAAAPGAGSATGVPVATPAAPTSLLAAQSADDAQGGCAVDVQDVSLRLGDFRLRDVNMQVAPGSLCAILGRTGSGKTVLMEAIAGAYQLEQGRVLLDGQDGQRISPQKRGMGIVYQDCALFPHLTVRDNVAYGLRMRRVPAARRDELVGEALALFGIAHLADCFPGTISGGEAQRASLARALVLQPRLLLLDEPFSALDPVTRRRLHETLRDIHRSFSCTIIFVTHDFHEARELAEQVVIILDGELRARTDAKGLFEGEFDQDVMCFLGREAPGTQEVLA